MERSSGPIMCISSVDWSFCKTHSEENTEMDVKRSLLWPCQHIWSYSLYRHEHRGHNRLLYARQKLLLSDETIGLRPLLRVKLIFCEWVKWLFCAWDECSGSVVFRQEVEPLADGLEAPRGPMSKSPDFEDPPSHDRTIWPLLYPQSGFSVYFSCR